MNSDLNNSIAKFLDLFEEVFDRDWKHSREMLGIRDETKEQKRAAQEMGLETIEIIARDGTFIHPKVEDEIEDWRNRGALLEEYHKLKGLLKKE